VFGRLSDNAGDGRVYVFHRQGGVWAFFQEIVPLDGAGSHDALAFAGDRLIVGSPGAYDPRMNGGSGAVSIYALQNGQWVLSETLYSYNGYMAGSTDFGAALAVDGSLLYVGFPGYVTPSGLRVGAVEVYDTSVFPTSYIDAIVSPEAVAEARFGSSVAASQHNVAVGANNLGFAGIGASVGAIFTYTEFGNRWTEGPMLMAPNPYAFDQFPVALAVGGGRIIAGDANHNSASKGGPWGLAFSYARSVNGFAFEAGLSPADGYQNDRFGDAVASAGELALIGAPNGGPAGHVYAFRAVGGDWQSVSEYVVADLADGDGFGTTMASDGATLVVGASEAGRTPASSGAIYAIDNLPTDQIFAEGLEP